MPSSTGAPRKRRFAGAAFSLVTFFWPNKKKLPAAGLPRLTPAPPALKSPSGPEPARDTPRSRDAAKLDRALLIFVEIVLDRTTPDVFDAFAKAVRKMPEVLECHMVAGGFDYLIKARVKDMAAYRAFLGDSLTNLPGVRETHTYAVMEEVKNSLKLAL